MRSDLGRECITSPGHNASTASWSRASNRRTEKDSYEVVKFSVIKRSLQNKGGDEGLVIPGGLTLLVRSHGVAEAPDDFLGPVASVAEHARQAVLLE